MSREDAGGLSLLGGYGTGSDEDERDGAASPPADVVGAARADPASRSPPAPREGGPGGDGVAPASPREPPSTSNRAPDAAPAPGPARPGAAEREAMIAAAYGAPPPIPNPSPPRGDDPSAASPPAAGPSRPAAADARAAMIADAYGADPRVGAKRPAPGSPPETARDTDATADAATGDDPAAPPGPAPAPPRTRVARSAPAAYLATVSIPPRPRGECTLVTSSGDSLQSKVERWLELKRGGVEINDQLRRSRGFRNPDFLAGATTHFGVDERGTMFAPDVFDPSALRGEDFYDHLAQAQKREAERRERERRERGIKDRRVAFEPERGGAPGGGARRAAASRSTIEAAIEEAKRRAAFRGR